MKVSSVRTRLVLCATFVLSLVIFMCLGWSSYRNLVAASEATRWERHTYLVIDGLDKLLSSLQDAETGERGFIITGDRKYLAPYYAALSVTPARLAALRKLTRDNPNQQLRLDTIEALVRTELSELDGSIKLRSTKGFQSAKDSVTTNLGKKTMDAIRELLGRAWREEEQLLRERFALERKYSNRNFKALFFGDILVLIVVVALYSSLWRELAKRLRTENELTIHRDLLKDQAEELTQSLKSLEEEMADRQKSEEQLRLLIAGTKDYALFMLDIDGRVSSWNEGAERLKGWKEGEILGRHFSLFYPEEAVAAGRPEHDLALAAAEGQFEEEDWRVRKDGSKFMADVIITPIRDGSGKLRGFSKVIRDITERKQAAEQIQAARMELERSKRAEELHRLEKEATEALRLEREATESLRQEKVAAESNARLKSQFLVNMSHELRTPMTGILGMLQLTLEEDLAPVPRDYLETTLSSARSLLRILNDILDMAKFEARKLIIEEKPFSPRRCITQAVDFITPEVRRKGLGFDLSVAKEVPNTVVGDQLRLRQVLINLIGNAIKFTDGGKVEVRVTAAMSTCEGKREFTFAITDTGIGIPNDKKELLFQTFSQVDPSLSRSFGGTGLGLAISREIVELMGGTISFVSEEGMGSTFSFTIPLGKVGIEPNALSAVEILTPETIPIGLKGERIPRILLAEDDPTIRQVLGLMLKRANFNLQVAEDGLQAIAMWEKGGYDLVLMDIQMPRVNGFEATRVIREKERERGGHTPIVAMTAHASKDDRDSCLAAGMDGYLSKPIDFKMALQVIRDTLK